MSQNGYIGRPLKNVQFCSRPRAILQDSRIGQLTSCPQGRGAWTPRVDAKILKGTKLSIIFVEIKPNKILDNMDRNT